jgi:3-phosphoshikimate 1-carboxyvinyltransferase
VPLPPLIEIVPLTSPVRAEITVPGSKSITNRALILAALADGRTTLRGALWSEDTQVMTDCLRALGFTVDVQPDPAESCNRTITVDGLGGRLPRAGTAAQPLELFVGNAGTAARFLAAMVCLGDGVYRLSGVPRMHERPQAALFAALRELGYRVESERSNDCLPARIYGLGPKASKCKVSIEKSSQFASALHLSSTVGGWEIQVEGSPDWEEMPYVEMTIRMLNDFDGNDSIFVIEPDCSSGSYFWAAGWIQSPGKLGVKVNNWPTEKLPLDAGQWQIDASFISYLGPNLITPLSRKTDLGDSIMTAIVLAPFASVCTRFTDLGRLRVQECERVVALRTELTKCGAKVIEEGDTLTVFPSALHGAEIETYDDHRMAMCFAVLGLKVPGIKIKNPACVKKTFPNFFQKLATPPPHGLGAEIRDAATGRKLAVEELFAD